MGKVDSLNPRQRATCTRRLRSELFSSFSLHMPSKVPVWRRTTPLSLLSPWNKASSFAINGDWSVSCTLWLINNGRWEGLINSQEERKPTSLPSEWKWSYLEGLWASSLCSPLQVWAAPHCSHWQFCHMHEVYLWVNELCQVTGLGSTGADSFWLDTGWAYQDIKREINASHSTTIRNLLTQSK